MALECGRIDAARQVGYSADDFFLLFDVIGYELFDLFGRPFGKREFYLPWNDHTVPHYIVATVDPAVPLLLNKICWDALDSVR